MRIRSTPCISDQSGIRWPGGRTAGRFVDLEFHTLTATEPQLDRAAQHIGPDVSTPETLIQSLGARSEIDEIAFNARPSCRGTHVYIEAAAQLVRDDRMFIG